MSLSYDPLWKMLNELHISKMEFAKAVGISNATLAKLGKNEPITLTTIDKICNEFECQIENVVQHIPDLLLEQRKSNLALEKGSIVLVSSSSEAPPQNLKSTNTIRPWVIIKQKEEIINNISTWQYIAAPITSAPTHYLSIYFEDVIIDKKISHGWISLDCLQNIPSKQLLRLTGKMPDNVIEKIERFITSVEELLK